MANELLKEALITSMERELDIIPLNLNKKIKYKIYKF